MDDETVLILIIIIACIGIPMHIALLRRVFRIDEIIRLLNDIKKSTSSGDETEPDKQVDYMTWLNQKSK